MRIETYVCDVCKKQSSDRSFIKRDHDFVIPGFPVAALDMGITVSGFSPMRDSHMCESCAKEIEKMIREKLVAN